MGQLWGGQSILVIDNAKYNVGLDFHSRRYTISLTNPPQKQVTFVCKNAHVRDGESVFVFGDVETLSQGSLEKALHCILILRIIRPDQLQWHICQWQGWYGGSASKEVLPTSFRVASNKIYPQDDNILTATAAFALPLEKINIPKVVRQDTAFEDLFSLEHVRSIFIDITEREWNNHLNDIDRSVNRKSEIYRLANFYYGTDRATAEKIPNVGFRIRGNSSRRRPEEDAPHTHHASRNRLVRAHFRIKFNEEFDDYESVYRGSENQSARRTSVKLMKTMTRTRA